MAAEAASGARPDEARRRLAINYLLTAACLWLLNQPYTGLRHDAWLYAVAALRWLDPQAYARDPFFMFGSQDDFTLFSPLFGTLIGGVGLSKAALLLTAAGGMLWLAAFWRLARSLLGDVRASGIALLAAAVYAWNYSPNFSTFTVNESFATARILAIPLGLLALSYAVDGRPRPAWPIAAAAMLLHPLLGIWPCALMLIARWRDRTLLLGLCAVAASLVVAGATLPAFQVMQSEWRQLVAFASKDVFVGPWGQLRLSSHLFWISVLWAAGCWGRTDVRRWYLAAAWLAAWAFLLAELCSAFHPIQLLIQVQLWRVMWLAVCLGVLALIDLSWRFAVDRRRLLIWLAISALLFVWQDVAGYLALAAMLALRGGLEGRVVTALDLMLRTRQPWFVVLCVGILLVLLPNYLQDLVLLGDGWGAEWSEAFTALRGFAVAGGGGLGIVAIAMLLPRLQQSWLCSGLLFVMAALAAVHWDRRAPGVEQWESRAAPEFVAPDLRARVQRGDTVLWSGHFERVWYELRTAGYASSEQAVGIVFSRQKAEELIRRVSRLAIGSVADRWPLDQAQQAAMLRRYRQVGHIVGPGFGSFHQYNIARLTDKGIAFVCEDPALDWIVTGFAPHAPFVPPIEIKQAGRNETLYLYDCRRFRAAH